MREQITVPLKWRHRIEILFGAKVTVGIHLWQDGRMPSPLCAVDGEPRISYYEWDNTPFFRKPDGL